MWIFARWLIKIKFAVTVSPVFLYSVKAIVSVQMTLPTGTAMKPQLQAASLCHAAVPQPRLPDNLFSVESAAKPVKEEIQTLQTGSMDQHLVLLIRQLISVPVQSNISSQMNAVHGSGI